MTANHGRLHAGNPLAAGPHNMTTPSSTPPSVPGHDAHHDTDAALAAQVSLRYRPGGDVLIGAVTYADDHAVNAGDGTALAPGALVERPDADTRLVWHVPTSGPFTGETLLASFEIIHARARWDVDELAVLPRALAVAGYSTMAEGATAYSRLETSVDRLRYRTEHTLELPFRALRHPRSEVTENTPYRYALRTAGSHHDALGVARSLERLAGALRRTESPIDPVARQRLTRFCLLADELANVLADADTPIPAPATSAALRAELRGGLPLARSERAALRDALLKIDDPRRWSEVTARLGRVAAALIEGTNTQERPPGA